MGVYVDTSAWIAFLTKQDSHHESAKEYLREAGRQRTPLRTGLHTVVEVVDGIAGRRGQKLAAEVLSQIMASRIVKVVPSEPVFEAACGIFGKNLDWNIDLSDCLSFALMESRGIRQAFTYDKDFEKAGFERVG